MERNRVGASPALTAIRSFPRGLSLVAIFWGIIHSQRAISLIKRAAHFATFTCVIRPVAKRMFGKYPVLVNIVGYIAT